MDSNNELKEFQYPTSDIEYVVTFNDNKRLILWLATNRWDQAWDWIKNTASLNDMEYIIYGSKTPNDSILFRRYIRCKMNQQNKSSSANTNCSSRGIVVCHANKSILPDDAFFGRGSNGPRVIMTDDSAPEREALRRIFPHATLLLCVFHILQALWRWLWDKKHGIKVEHRQVLFQLVKNLVYTSTEEQLPSVLNNLMHSPISVKYPQFLHYVDGLYARRQQWAIVLRKTLPLDGIHTNNFVEAAFRVLKDKVLKRIKAHNVVELAEFVTHSLSTYYSRRLIDIINNKICSASQRRFPATCEKEMVIEEKEIQIVDDANSLFSVSSQSVPDVRYHVDMKLGICGCPVGFSGKPCKHQYAIFCHFGKGSDRFEPLAESQRRLFHFVATGRTDLPPGFFLPLSSQSDKMLPTEVPSTSQAIEDNRTDPMDTDITDGTTMVSDEFIIEKIKSSADTLIQRVLSDRETLLSGIEYFDHQVKNLRGSAALNSYLHSNISNYSPSSGRRIRVQPRAIGRRSSTYRGCRSMGYPGRPIGASSTKKRSKRKHSLRDCVKKNSSLGKTHSAK